MALFSCSSTFSFYRSYYSTSKPRSHPSVRCSCPSQYHSPDDDAAGDPDDSKHRHHLRLLLLPATLTLIPSSLTSSSAAIAAPNRSVSAISPEDLKSRWSSTSLPTVSDRIPYTELVLLSRSGRLSRLIRPPSSSSSSASLRQSPTTLLAVVLPHPGADPNTSGCLVRVVLPSISRDPAFWSEWDGLNLNSILISPFTPVSKKPSFPTPFLGFLSKIPIQFLQLFVPKPKSKRVLEIEAQRKALAQQSRVEVDELRREQESLERMIRAQKKASNRKKRLEEKKVKYEMSLKQARKNYRKMGSFWAGVARDKNIASAIGVLMFFAFYQTVVLNYRKQQKDYEDRLKIEKADAEERKKMRRLERELTGLEGDDDEEDLEGKGTSSEDNPYLKMAKRFMQSGARVRRARSKRLPQYLERDVDVKFADVAGLGNIRMELEEIVKFFTMGEMYRRRGVKIPGGILLCGPPGVGKTLLAKAVAGEAGVNFFSISASQFVEIYVGVGASRVRALYQEARENAPSVVFIDELDAVGRERGLIKGSGGQERDATLNQLLVCLDGFEGRGNVITIAATNRPDILDPALVRPGRFDRKIFIPKPSVVGRVEILQVHALKKPMADDVDFMAVASMTDGMVGAELANIIEIAAINMLREGRTEITTDDLLQAAQIEERGMLDKKERSLDMWNRLALNEAAMAVTAVNFPDLKNIEFITISPRAGRELGYVRVKMDHMKFTGGMLSRQSLLDHITVQIAPRAADEIWHGESQLSTLWAETANNARSAARSFVLGGLSDKYYGLSNFWISEHINDIDLEALHVLNACYERAKEILQQNRDLMDAVVERLVEKKSLTKNEFFQLVADYGHLNPMPSSIVDIRNAKRLQFQEMMIEHSFGKNHP